MKLDRLLRVMSVVEIVRNKPGITYQELAEEFEVSERTIRRDVNIIEDAGIPIKNCNGLRLVSDIEIPKVQLNSHELIFLLLVTHFLSSYELESEVPDSMYKKLSKFLPKKITSK
ncbi:helix-turn-helix transcriptional regulator [Natranaerofaba carboxydovora]|uniref:helix-turn-helix transcriptional regulator n=1 Tax=Natranaerofaba carboxydovora TaxID=2742683 RepID=UPI001F134D80|nr:HTH domain-containing protein [Natranaerofaba carboxydovora]UMZ73752.1 HTH domain protein [Natranaerofaba carboxydovora]